MAQPSWERLPYELGDETIAEARERLYPDWEWLSQRRELNTATAPRYIIRPRDEADRQIAYFVRPAGIIVEIRPVEE